MQNQYHQLYTCKVYSFLKSKNESKDMTIRAPVGSNYSNYIDLWLILTTRTMTKMIWNCFLQPPTWVTWSESPSANLESSSQGARPPSYSHGDCCWGWWWCCSWGLSYRRPCLPISASSASQNQFQILLFPTKQAAHCRASSMFTAAAKRSQRWAKLKSWTKSRKRGNTQPPTRPPEGKRFTGLPAA